MRLRNIAHVPGLSAPGSSNSDGLRQVAYDLLIEVKSQEDSANQTRGGLDSSVLTRPKRPNSWRNECHFA